MRIHKDLWIIPCPTRDPMFAEGRSLRLTILVFHALFRAGRPGF